MWGVRKLARLWTSRTHRKQVEVQQEGWSDFLGRDESDATLSTRLEPVINDAEAEGEGDGERKSPAGTPPLDPGNEAEAADVSLDLLTALDRGPSRTRTRTVQ